MVMQLLIIWNACPLLTKERMAVKDAPTVRQLNEDNAKLYEELAKYSGSPINTPEDVANLYATIRAEVIIEKKRKGKKQIHK